MSKLEETIQEILQKSIEVAEKTGEFVIDQTSDVIQQFLLWETTASCLGILLGVFLIILGFKIPKLWGSDGDDDDEFEIFKLGYNIEGFILAICIIIVFNTAGIIVTLRNIYTLVKVLVAPKVYLIEHFVEFFK